MEPSGRHRAGEFWRRLSLTSGATFSEPGSYVLRLTGTEAQFSLESDVVIVVNDNYASWATLSGVVGGKQDDDDDDGICNLVEYAFGLSPLVHDADLFPEAGLAGGEYFLDYRHLTRKKDIVIEVQSSSGLA